MRPRLAVLAALLAALACPASALGHAQLLGTSPQRGALVERQPGAVVFRFDEPVEGNFGAVRVYDAGGGRVDEGDAFHPGGEGSRIGVHLKPGLRGSYTATYRVVSADGHIVSGGFVFSVGRAGRAPRDTVAQLIGGASSGPVTEAAFGVARGLQYAATALAVGALAFLLGVWLPGLAAAREEGEGWPAASSSFARRLRRVLLAAAAAGALSACAGVVLEGAEAAGVTGFAALEGTILRETLGTRFGAVWGLTALAWVAFGLLAALLPRDRDRAPRGWAAALLAASLLLPVLEPALSGHGSTQSPVALLFPANALHVAAMAVWMGGLATLLLVVPAATRRLGPPRRGRLLAALLARFSQIALAAVGVVLLTGLVQAYAYVRHLDALTATGYGRAVLAKLLLLGALIGLGAYNRRRSVPRLRRVAAGGEPPGRAGLLLRRALRAEVALLVVVLGVTAALASYAPPIAARSGPYSAEARLGPAELQVTVDPARVGANAVHIYLFDARSGAQYTRAREVRVEATMPAEGIGPLDLEPQLSGPGHYTVPRALLSVAGEWRIAVTVRVSAFDELSRSLEVPIR